MFVRRTGEVIPVKVIPSVSTYGDIIQEICKKRRELDPSHYFIALNYSTEMNENMRFEGDLKNARFQMFMKTKWLMEHIAEQAIHKKRMDHVEREELDTQTSTIDRK